MDGIASNVFPIKKRETERENESKTTPRPSTKHKMMDVRVSRKGLRIRVCKELPERVGL